MKQSQTLLYSSADCNSFSNLKAANDSQFSLGNVKKAKNDIQNHFTNLTSVQVQKTNWRSRRPYHALKNQSALKITATALAALFAVVAVAFTIRMCAKKLSKRKLGKTARRLNKEDENDCTNSTGEEEKDVEAPPQENTQPEEDGQPAENYDMNAISPFNSSNLIDTRQNFPPNQENQMAVQRSRWNLSNISVFGRFKTIFFTSIGAGMLACFLLEKYGRGLSEAEMDKFTVTTWASIFGALFLARLLYKVVKARPRTVVVERQMEEGNTRLTSLPEVVQVFITLQRLFTANGEVEARRAAAQWRQRVNQARSAVSATRSMFGNAQQDTVTTENENEDVSTTEEASSEPSTSAEAVSSASAESSENESERQSQSDSEDDTTSNNASEAAGQNGDSESDDSSTSGSNVNGAENAEIRPRSSSMESDPSDESYYNVAMELPYFGDDADDDDRQSSDSENLPDSNVINMHDGESESTV